VYWTEHKPGAGVAGKGGPVAGRGGCDRDEAAALLVPITRALDIGLYVGLAPALDAIKDDLLATVLR